MVKIKRPQVLSNKASSSTRSIFSTRTKALLLSGLILMMLPLVFYLNQTIQLMYFTPPVKNIVVTKTEARLYAPPTHITIQKVGISLPIVQTTIQNNTWSIAGEGASHLSESANPGQKGPIIMYAHNTRDRFGPIRWLNTGEIITVTSADKKIHSYKIIDRIKTSPKELSVFFARKTETLYLFTCDGFADLDRYIVVADPVSSPSASITK